MLLTATHNSTGPSLSSTGARPLPRAGQPHPPSRKNRIRHERSSGGIIYRRRGAQIEIFFIKDPYGRWTFPKGHQELGETLVQTAVREIQEETGLTNLRYIAPIGRTSFQFRREKTVIDKTVYFFLFEASPDAKEKITGEDEIWEATWARAQEAFATSGYRNLDRLLAKALRLISYQKDRTRGREWPRQK